MLREFIASQFRKPSGLFGNLTSKVMVKRNRIKYERIIRDLDIQLQDKILEIGYGPGAGIRMIVETYPSCFVHGIDFSKLMHRKASANNRQYIHSGRVQLQHGNFLELPLPDDEYDKVFCINVIYFWKELSVPFKKVTGNLRKGGGFHIYMADESFLRGNKAPDGIFQKYSLEHVLQELKAAGFETVDYYSDGGHFIKAIK